MVTDKPVARGSARSSRQLRAYCFQLSAFRVSVSAQLSGRAWLGGGRELRLMCSEANGFKDPEDECLTTEQHWVRAADPEADGPLFRKNCAE